MEIYILNRQETKTLKFWKLKATIYGRCDAPNLWYLSVKFFLLESGVKKVNLMNQYSTSIKMADFKV